MMEQLEFSSPVTFRGSVGVGTPVLPQKAGRLTLVRFLAFRNAGASSATVTVSIGGTDFMGVQVPAGQTVRVSEIEGALVEAGDSVVVSTSASGVSAFFWGVQVVGNARWVL